MAASALVAAAAAVTFHTAIVATDRAELRTGPRESAPAQAQLWQGEALEVRGERLGFLQVWDYHRERGGYVRASQVRRTTLAPAEAPDLLAVIRFLREAPGAESLGIGLAAAYLQAAPAETLRGPAGAEALDALGTFAERLADRASDGVATSKAAQSLSSHLEVAARYGVKFNSYEQGDGRMRLCYDGDAFARVLALPAPAQQKARAALALTRPDCVDPALQPIARHERNVWRAAVLDRVELPALPDYLRARVTLRRAAVWATLAYEDARLGQPAQAAAERALAELGSVQKEDVAEDDLPAWNDAAMRVNASRWAAVPAQPALPAAGDRPWITTQPGAPGETCVLLLDRRHDGRAPLAKRCTYALVWPQSASVDRSGKALVLAVQPLEAWRELWVFRKQRGRWNIDVLPPAPLQPQIGYAEFAGWVPGGRQMLVAREARAEGRYRRRYEVVSLASLATQQQAYEPTALGAFQRWQDPQWKRLTVSLR